MDSNLFVNIQKYRPREGRNSLEDFITEIFAYLLKNDEEYKTIILKYFGYSSVKNISNVSTQIGIQDYGRPDIILSQGVKEKIIVEVKVASKQNSGKSNLESEEQNNINRLKQLEKYLAIPNLEKLIYITKNNEITGIKDKRLKHIFWYEIYTMTDNYLNDSIQASNEICIIYKNFISLLKSNNMTPFYDIELEDIKGYIHTIDNIYKLFDQLVNALGEENLDGNSNTRVLKENSDTFSIQTKFKIKNDREYHLVFDGEEIVLAFEDKNFDIENYYGSYNNRLGNWNNFMIWNIKQDDKIELEKLKKEFENLLKFIK